MFYVYILYSFTTRKFYTGQTEDLDRRLMEHNSGKTTSNERGIPWKIVFSEAFQSRSESMAMEKKIKNRGASRFLEDNGVYIG